MSYTPTKRQKTAALIVSYLLIWLLASYIFYRRFPLNFQDPNFYAEDGFIFGRNIIEHGFIQAAFTTFSGYFITGLYIIEKIAFMLNAVVFGNEFVNLAKSFALVSYGFLGFVTTLPLLLFRKYLSLPILIAVAVLSIFVPIMGSDYAVIGAIGNLKFSFTYIAFLLIVYRHLMPRDSKKVYLVDFGLLICGYTNITVYLLLLFTVVRYLPAPRSWRKLTTLGFYRQLLRDRSFQSLLGLAVLLLPQLAVIALHGIPQQPGYLDSAYRPGSTVEIFFDRSFLYAFLFPVNKFLNDAIVISASLVAIVGGIWGSGKYRKLFLFGLFAIFATSFLFVSKRTGVSEFYGSYASGGPDQFFYTQNLITYFIFGLALVWLGSQRLPDSFRRVCIIAIALAIGQLISFTSAHTYNDFEVTDVGNIYANAQKFCSTNPSASATYNLAIYPSPIFHYAGLSRQTLCTPSVARYQPHTVPLGLKPNGHYVDGLGSAHTLTQTFLSPRDNLDGLEIYFSTFARSTRTPYDLKIYDASCQHLLRSTAIPLNRLHDNAFAEIPFTPLRDSHNQHYCFNVTASDPSRADPLALQLSAPNIYSDGQATLDNTMLTEDVVFKLHYK